MNKKDILNKIKSLDGLNQDERAYLVNLVNTKKNYGLVWEDKPEDVEEQLRTKLPVLQEVKERAIINDAVTSSTSSRAESRGETPNHILIEGDNLHALTALTFTHENKIDLIYIDPPYNRGGDFKYNDSFIDKEDAFRHSKWISFMNKRLTIAQKLLKDSGVMFISIDDAEYVNLKQLCNSIFTEEKVETFIWRKSGYGRDGKMKNTTTFRVDHEYILVCYKKEKVLNKIKEKPNFQNTLNNPDNDPRGNWLSGSISRTEKASNPEHKNFFTIQAPGGKIFTRQFDISEDEFKKLDSDGRISWGKTGNSVPRIKVFEHEEREITPYSVFLEKGTTTDGTKQVTEILNKDASEMRPKPTSLVETLIQLGVKTDDGLVLDFFAGTGTTGHSTILYNQKYNKNLSFIMATNNDEGICAEYCYPRIKTVFRGFKSGKFTSNKKVNKNLRYYKTAFVDREPSLQNKRQLTQLATELLCIKEDCYTEVQHHLSISPKQAQIFTNNKGKYLVAIYHSRNQLQVQEQLITWVDSLTNTTEKVRLYAFSPEKEVLAEEFYEVAEKVEVVPLPEAIYNAYLSTIKALKLDKKQVYNNNTAEA